VVKVKQRKKFTRIQELFEGRTHSQFWKINGGSDGKKQVTAIIKRRVAGESIESLVKRFGKSRRMIRLWIDRWFRFPATWRLPRGEILDLEQPGPQQHPG